MLTSGATAVQHLSAPEARQHPTAGRTSVGRTYLQSSEGGQRWSKVLLSHDHYNWSVRLSGRNLSQTVISTYFKQYVKNESGLDTKESGLRELHLLSSADDFLPALAALYRLKPVFKRGRAGLDFVNAQGSSCNITDDTERRVVRADRRRARYREKQRCRLR